MEWTSPAGKIMLAVEGDITRISADAVVNAANSALAGGGGVDGAIHRAAGPEIMRELDVIRAQSGGCPTGSAVTTGAGRLPARHILHAVGPVYRDGRHGEPDLLASCYRACLSLAETLAAASIAFPAISTGIYGYPLEDAARIAIREVKTRLEQPNGSIQRVTFVLFGKAALEVYMKVIAEISA